MTRTENENWARVKERLRDELGEDVYSRWFDHVELGGSEGDTVKLSVPTRFLKSWIQSHYSDRMLACWQAEQPNLSQIKLMVRSAVIRAPKSKPAEDHHRPTGPVSMAHEALGGSALDPRLTFDTFVVGRSNTLAHAAAKQVAQASPGEMVIFNPLYIYASIGRGKTHLMQSLAWAGNANAERKVLYLTAEKFMHGFVAALRSQNALAFKEALRTIDVLAVDDVQSLQGQSTQAEFCHTLNALIDAGSQVVLAADRPPSELESLEEHVRSRLASGLMVEMGALGEELRLDILRCHAAAAKLHYGFDIPQTVLAFIAKTVTDNGHHLEAALDRLLAQTKLSGEPLTVEMAEREARDLISSQELTSEGKSKRAEHPSTAPFFGNVFVLGKAEELTKPSFAKGEQLDHEPLHYTACGLNEVYLLNGFMTEIVDGEEHVSIEDLDGLWKSIGLHLVTARKSLAPNEIRFLRHHMGLTQAELATKLRVSDQTVARWEKGQTDPGPADIAVRIQFLASRIAQPEGEQFLLKIVNILDELIQCDDGEPKPVAFERGKKKWKKSSRELRVA
jgi:chromosomal replication initiator protein